MGTKTAAEHLASKYAASALTFESLRETFDSQLNTITDGLARLHQEIKSIQMSFELTSSNPIKVAENVQYEISWRTANLNAAYLTSCAANLNEFKKMMEAIQTQIEGVPEDERTPEFTRLVKIAKESIAR